MLRLKNTLIAIALMYAIWAFVSLKPNPTQWSEGERASYVFICLVIVFVVNPVADFFKTIQQEIEEAEAEEKKEQEGNE
jgi:hypothetical protein